MDYDEIPLGADELTPTKPLSAERAEEIAEIMAEVGRIFAELNAEESD